MSVSGFGIFMGLHLMSRRMLIFYFLKEFVSDWLYFFLKYLEFAKGNHLGLITDSVS